MRKRKKKGTKNRWVKYETDGSFKPNYTGDYNKYQWSKKSLVKRDYQNGF